MRKSLILVFVALAFSHFVAQESAAIGLGGYLEAGAGTGEFEFDTPGSEEFDVDENYAALGFVLDTATRDESFFNYRLNVGLVGLDLEDDADDTLEMGGIVVDNTFGFAFVRNQSLRVWAGPQIRIGFFSGENEHEIMGDKLEVDLANFGIGAVVGANFGVGDSMNISLSGGVRFNGYAGEAELLGVTEDIEGSTRVWFLNVALMYDGAGR